VGPGKTKQPRAWAESQRVGNDRCDDEAGDGVLDPQFAEVHEHEDPKAEPQKLSHAARMATIHVFGTCYPDVRFRLLGRPHHG